MIPAHIFNKIKRIHIKSRKSVNNIMAGQYKSVFKGSGIEFEEVREYSPGDDVKALDWKVSARLGKPFIKLYKEERESIVMLLIDMSASLKFGTFNGQKLEKVAEVASVLAFNAIKNNDKVGVIFFTDRIEKYIPPKKGSGHVWRVIKEIFTFSPEGKGTNISIALNYLSKISRKKSFVFVLSDFMDMNMDTDGGDGGLHNDLYKNSKKNINSFHDLRAAFGLLYGKQSTKHPKQRQSALSHDSYLKSLRIVRQRHEIIGVMIYDKGAFELPVKGIITLSDFETSQQIVFDSFNKKTKNGFLTLKKRNHAQVINTFLRAKSDVIEIPTNASVQDTLLKYFNLRERRLR